MSSGIPFNVQNLGVPQSQPLSPSAQPASNTAAIPVPKGGPIADDARIKQAEGPDLIAGYEKIVRASVNEIIEGRKEESGPPLKITLQIKARTYRTDTPPGQPEKARDRIWEVTLTGDCANLVLEKGNIDPNKRKAFIDRYVAALVVQDQLNPSQYFHRATHAFVSLGANGKFHVDDVELANYLLPKWLSGRKKITSHIHSKIIMDSGQMVVSANPERSLPQNDPEYFHNWLQKIINGEDAAAQQQAPAPAMPPAPPPPASQQPLLNARVRAPQSTSGATLGIQRIGDAPEVSVGNSSDSKGSVGRE
jgi:hypothetical protein